METKFIADNNVGKLARWLRLMGYDTLLLERKDDARMIRTALGQDRVILTKDSQFMKRRLVTKGTLRTVHIEQGNPVLQLRQVVRALGLDYCFKPFSLCLECNQELVVVGKEEVKNLVPARVFQTQTQYKRCPACHRIYWPGTHWQDMSKKLQDLQRRGDENHAPA